MLLFWIWLLPQTCQVTCAEKNPPPVIFQSLPVLALDAIAQQLNQPEFDPVKKVNTLNGMGGESTILDPATSAFLAEMSLPENRDKVVLQIGCPYGLTAERAIRLGVKNYILNDMELRHLKMTARRLYERREEIGQENLSHFHFFHGIFPYDFADHFPQVDRIIMIELLYFLRPKDIKPAFIKLNKILKMGGLVYILTLSPDCQMYAPFKKVYDTNVAQGKAFPGYCVDSTKYCESNQDIMNIETSILFFSLEELKSLFAQYGFKLRHSWLVNNPSEENLSWQPGKDMIAAIFEKEMDLD